MGFVTRKADKRELVGDPARRSLLMVMQGHHHYWKRASAKTVQ